MLPGAPDSPSFAAVVQLCSLLLSGEKMVILVRGSQPCKIWCEIILVLFLRQEWRFVFHMYLVLGGVWVPQCSTACEDLTRR